MCLWNCYNINEKVERNITQSELAHNFLDRLPAISLQTVVVCGHGGTVDAWTWGTYGRHIVDTWEIWETYVRHMCDICETYVRHM